MKHTVYRVCQEGTRLFLLVETDGIIGVSVYDEHTDSTLMRIKAPVTANDLQQAIDLLKKGK